MKSNFEGMTTLEVVETLLIERGEAPSLPVFRELLARGVPHEKAGQACDMAGGGRTYIGTRESAIEFMVRLVDGY